MQHWKEPRHPTQVLYSKRLLSFHDWPRQLPPTAERLSKAGFFYNGKNLCIQLLLTFFKINSVSFILTFVPPRYRRSVCLLFMRSRAT